MICEKCWADAYVRALSSGKPQYEEYKALLDERKDHIGDATVMIPRDVAESLRQFLEQPIVGYGMETHRAEAYGMDEEYSALCKALGEARDE